MKKKLMASILAASMLVSMAAGCGNTEEQTDAPAAEASGTTADAAAESGAADTDGEEVTIKLFSNLPDRKNGQGLVEQTIIDQYMSENPNVNIEVEALDEESYKTKFKAYAMDGMPDVVSIWGQPSFLDEVLDAGVLAELNESDYSDYGFVSGSLEGFKKDGKLYGLPRNTDIMVFYYNEKMFDDNGWEVPQTYDDLLALYTFTGGVPKYVELFCDNHMLHVESMIHFMAQCGGHRSGSHGRRRRLGTGMLYAGSDGADCTDPGRHNL